MKTHALTLGLLLSLPALACAQDITIPPRLTGNFEVTDNAKLEGTEVDIHMVDGLSYHVHFGERWFRVTRPDVDTHTMSGPELDPTKVKSSGITGALNGEGPGTWETKGSATLTLEVIDVRNFDGEIDESSGTDPKFKLLRRTMIPADDMDSFDRGPRGRIARHLARAPRYPNTGDYKGVFWADWGAVFYRGRLNGTARLLGIASDPGPTEGLPFVRRSLVGDAGQRTQGFLEKLGLTRSYVLVNAFTYPTRPSRVDQGRKLFRDFPDQLQWRNEYYDLLYSSGNIQGIALFGQQASKAFRLWNDYRQANGHPDLRDEVTVVEVPHPSSGRGDWDSFASKALVNGWRRGVRDLRKVVTPDDEDLAKQPNFGLAFSEVDYAPIPPVDLPKKAQTYPGIRDNSWSRTKVTGRRNNSVRRYGSKSMQFNTLAGEEVWLRVVGQNLLSPNRTPRYRRFKTPADISVYAVRQRFGASSKYLGRMKDLSKTRYLNVLKLVDSSSRTEAQVREGLDKLLPDPDAGLMRLAKSLALSGAVIALLAGCDDQSAAKTSSGPEPVSPASVSPAPVTPVDPTPGGAPSPTLAATPTATPTVSPTTPKPVEKPKGPRDLDAILFELEEIEGMSANLEDPVADHEARFERVEDLAVEAAGFGLGILPLVHKRLIETRELPKEVGYLQRSDFLAHVFARMAAGDVPALEETAKLLATLTPKEFEAACEALPRGRRGFVLRGWLAQLSSPPGPNEGATRLALLHRYAKTEKTLDQPLLATLSKDPDAKVAAAANELKAR